MYKSPGRIVLILKKCGVLRDRQAIQGNLPGVVFWSRFPLFILKEIFCTHSVRFKDALGYRYVSPLNNLSSLITFVHGYRDPLIYRFYCKWVREGETVIDVGANVGTHLFQLAGLVGEAGRALAFEADPEVCLCLEKGLHSNGFQNIILRNCAVSKERGVVALQRNMSNRGLTSVVQTQQWNGLTLSCSTLDEEVAVLCPDTSISLIKIDVEGHEKEVLKGAFKLLSQKERLAIVMEHFGSDAPEEESAPSILRSHGFLPHRVTAGGDLEAAPDGIGDNVVWIK